MNIKPLSKGGQLKEIEPNEVSLVKHPANRRRFLITKAADLGIVIDTDQTFDGTGIMVNGEELTGFESFHLSIVKWSDEDMEEWGAVPVSASWTTRESSEDGLEQISTFTLQSEIKKMEKKEIIKLIKSAFDIDIDEAGFDALSDEQRASVTGFATFAPAMPDAFKKSTATALRAVIAKEPDGDETVPRDEQVDPVRAQLAALRAELDALKAATTPPEDPPETPPDEEDPPEGEGSEVAKAIAALTKELTAVKGDMALVRKAAGVKASGEEGADFQKGDEEVDLYPSIRL